MIFPKRRDIVIVDAEPHSGIEYGGHSAEIGNIRRHMVVVSSDEYNQSTGMMLAMPITTSDRYQNNSKYYPILISGGKSGVKGYIVLWQLQNFDFKARNGVIINKISQKQYNDLLPYIKDMLGIY